MAQPIPHQCPFHGGPVEVTEVSCVECDVQIRGHFTLSRYDRLSPDHLIFLETFLRCRGVIRDVEAALGISYPTVRARLDSVLTALDLNPVAEVMPGVPAPQPVHQIDVAAQRSAILKAINEGTIDAETGLKALQSLTKE